MHCSQEESRSLRVFDDGIEISSEVVFLINFIYTP
jgi:hypothetical protein